MVRRSLLIVVIAAAVAGITMAGPAISRTVVDYARNAGAVDGRSAVGAKTGIQHRARRLVATDKNGYLPDNIITEAPDAAGLGGLPPHRFVQGCGNGSVGGFALVPSDVQASWTSVDGYGYVFATGGPPPPKGQQPYTSCSTTRAVAEHVSAGTYNVALFGLMSDYSDYCSGNQTIRTLAAVANVNDSRQLVATVETGRCDPQQGLVLIVHISTLAGDPADATFTVEALQHPTELLP